MFWGNRSSSVGIAGRVCTFHIVISASPGLQERYWPEEEMLYEELQVRLSSAQPDQELLAQIRTIILSEIGNQFEIEHVTVNRGSIDIAILIATAGMIVQTISNYGSFFEGLDRIAQQLRSLFSRWARQVDRRPFKVRGYWIPGDGVIRILKAPLVRPEPNLVQLFVWYLIITNLGLLVVIVWMLLRR